MFELAMDKDTINLALGEPDFPIPPESKEAILEALEKDFTHYTPNKGIPELRSAVVERLERRGVAIGLEEVMVTSGASEALHLAILALVDHGDEVLIPDPGFVSYKPLVEIAGGRAVPYWLKEGDDFSPDPEEIGELMTNKTKMMVMNSPSNPTGAVFSKGAVKGIAEICEDGGAIVLSDEVYDEIIYEGEHHSPWEYSENAVIVNGFSKSYAMTGLRLGYVYASLEIIEEMLKVHQYIQASTCSLSQKAALAALGSRDFIESMVSELKERRDLVLDELSKMKVKCVKPDGAFYVFPSFPGYGDSKSLVMKILKEAKVVTTPGTAFGAGGEGHIRLSYATSKEKIREGIQRIRRCLNEAA